MGQLIYEGATKVDIEDRALAHVQVVVGNKLRRGESFYFSWRDDPSTGSGRASVWVHPGASLVFKYYGSRMPSLNRQWLEALSFVANQPNGLHLIPEPAETTPEARERDEDEAEADWS